MSSPAWSTSVTRERAIGNIESYVQAVYAYDVRTEIVGSKGSVFVGSLYQTPAIFLSTSGETRSLAEHFLTRLLTLILQKCAILLTTCCTTAPAGFRREGLRALAIAVAAENSLMQRRPCAVKLEAKVAVPEEVK